MRRRDFIALSAGTVATCSLAARAQQPAIPIIGFLSGRSPDTDAPLLAIFRQNLNEAGFVEGRNVAFEYHAVDGQYDRLPALAADLVRRQVAVIVAFGSDVAAQAAKAATATIPIVFVMGGDPVEYGLVSSLAHPGGNITGVTSYLNALGPKRLGLLHELLPSVTKIAVLLNAANPSHVDVDLNSVQTAARAIGREIVVLRAGTERQIESAFVSMVGARANALLVLTDPFFFAHANQIIALAVQHAIPALYFRREFAAAGGLMSYGSDTTDSYREVGIYAGRILKGEKPANLPVMQATKFELVINLKTAKALGLAVPPTLLARADEVIE
jgi:putative tryptophan/tyrosine transport system substrate-binding protein